MSGDRVQSSQRDPRVLVLGALLALALLAVGVSWWWNRPPAARALAPPLTTAEQMSQEIERLLAEVQAFREADARGVATDWPEAQVPVPVVPAADTRPAGATFRLRGMISGDGRPAAFLDDKVLLVGEKIAGYKLTDIAADHVTLVDPQGRVHRVYLESAP